MKAVQLRPTIHQRVDVLEEKAKNHEKMAPQVAEMYEVFDLTRKVFSGLNRASVKIAAALAGLTGAGAAVLTIIDKVRVLFGH